MSANPRLPFGIHRIVTPMPWRPKSVNAYLVELETGGWMLVDGGLPSEKAWHILDAAVRSICAWSDLKVHVLTHMHLDHIGLAARVMDASSVPLAMGALDAERAMVAAAEPEVEKSRRSAMLRMNGVPLDLVDTIARTAGVGPRDAGLPEPEYWLTGDSGVLPGTSEWRAIPTPGHTAGHISLFRERDAVLLSGDAVIPRISPTIGVTPQSPDPVGDYLVSLQRLDALQPRLILGGHGEPLSGPTRIGELRDELLRESERVRALLRVRPATPWEIAGRRYEGRELPTMLRIQGMRETRAHLDHLALLGEAVQLLDDEVVRFALPAAAR